MYKNVPIYLLIKVNFIIVIYQGENLNIYLQINEYIKYYGQTMNQVSTIQIFFFNFIYLFIYLWLCWVFVSVQGLSLVAASRCAGLSLSRPLLLQSTGSRRAGSVVVAHGPSHSAACGIFPDQGSNPCPLHWQADSQPLRHQGSPYNIDLYLLA